MRKASPSRTMSSAPASSAASMTASSAARPASTVTCALRSNIHATEFAAPLLGGDGDLTDELGEQRAAPRVGDGLLPLDLLPLTVAGHDGNLPRSAIRVEHVLESHPAPVKIQVNESCRPVPVLQYDQ